MRMNQVEARSVETDDRWLGSEVRICHKRGRIRRANDRSYEVSIEIGGVHQHVTVGAAFAHEQLEG